MVGLFSSYSGILSPIRHCRSALNQITKTKTGINLSNADEVPDDTSKL